MTRRTYTPEYKAKLVIEVLQGEKELNTISAVRADAHPAEYGRKVPVGGQRDD